MIDRSHLPTVHEVALGAYLHDVGKLIQRAVGDVAALQATLALLASRALLADCEREYSQSQQSGGGGGGGSGQNRVAMECGRPEASTLNNGILAELSKGIVHKNGNHVLLRLELRHRNCRIPQQNQDQSYE